MDLLFTATRLFAQTAEDAAGVAAAGGIGIGMLLVYGLLYVAVTFPMFKIAQKLGHENPWFAFVPILNLVQLVQITELEIWWVIVCLICGIAIIWPLMKLAAKLGKPEWMGLVVGLVPCVNIAILWMWAMEK